MRYHIFLFSLFGLFWLTACNLMPTPEPYELGGAVVNNPQPAPDFTLMSADGPVRLSDFAGKYVYIYFGYTFCPDVCPATIDRKSVV